MNTCPNYRHAREREESGVTRSGQESEYRKKKEEASAQGMQGQVVAVAGNHA
jgi:hypothetical protein